eukprot:5002947-Amphidinium_carterae.2
MDTITRSVGWLKSDQWGGEAKAEGGMIMGSVADSAVDQTYMVATLAMPATSAVRTWIIDTGEAQHLIGKSYLSKDEIQSIYTVAPVSLTTANDVVRTSSRLEIEIGSLGGLQVNPLVMDSSPCVLSAGIVESNATALTILEPEHFFMEFNICCGKDAHLCTTLIATNPRVRTYRVTDEMDGDDANTINIEKAHKEGLHMFVWGSIPYRDACKTRSIFSSWELTAQAVDECKGCLAMEWPDTCESWNLPVVRLENTFKDIEHAPCAKCPCPAYFAVVVHQFVRSWVRSPIVGCTAYSHREIATLVEDVLKNILSTMIPLNTTRTNVYDSRERQVRGLLCGASSGTGPQVAKAGFEHKMFLQALHSLASTSPIHT